MKGGIKWKKVGEWIHRIVGFTIFESLITIVSFAGIYTSMQVLGETNNLNFGTSMGLLQTGLAVAYLQVANIFYWIMDINLFDFKELWRKKKKKNGKTCIKEWE